MRLFKFINFTKKEILNLIKYHPHTIWGVYTSILTADSEIFNKIIKKNNDPEIIKKYILSEDFLEDCRNPFSFKNIGGSSGYVIIRYATEILNARFIEGELLFEKNDYWVPIYKEYIERLYKNNNILIEDPTWQLFLLNQL